MSKDSGLTLSDVVSAATFAVVVITAWLYVVGWTYVSQYFIQFRIPLLMLDLPLQHYLVYGGLVLWKSIWLCLGTSIAAVALAWVCVRWSTMLGRFAVSTILVAALLVFFLVGRFAGIATAEADFAHQYQNDYPAYPRVAVILRKEASEAIGDRIGDVANTDCGRLVLFSAGRLFLIRSVRGIAAAKPDSFVLLGDQLLALRLLDEYQSCG
jgi:hypothetical protein